MWCTGRSGGDLVNQKKLARNVESHDNNTVDEDGVDGSIRR